MMKAWDLRWLLVTCLLSPSWAKAAELLTVGELTATLDGKAKRLPASLAAEDALARLPNSSGAESEAVVPTLNSYLDTPILQDDKSAEEVGAPDPTVGVADDFRTLPAVVPSLGEDAAKTRFSDSTKKKTTKKTSRAKVEEFVVKAFVSGASPELAETLIAYLPSRRRLTCNTDAQRLERFITASQPKLQEGAEAMGYFDAKFAMTTARQNDCWVFNIQVAQGSPIRVVEQTIAINGKGENLKDFKEIKANKPYEIGEVLVHQPYEDYKDTLNQKANQLGFFDAQYKTRQLQIDPDKHEGKVVLDYNTGERYRIGAVDIKQDVLNEESLGHHIRVRPGDYYDSEKLLKMQRLLESTKYYKDVQVIPQHNAAKNRQIPVTIRAERNKQNSYTGKLGYGADTGARFEVKMETHWINDSGHKLLVEGIASKPEASLGATYKVPLWQPEHEYAALSAGWKRSDNNDIKSSALKSELSYNRRNDSDWQQTAFVTTLHETTQPVNGSETTSQLALLGARVKKTESDDLLFATNGWQFSAELQGAQKGLLSDQTLLQGKVSGKYLKTLASNDKIITQGVFGATLNDSLQAMPKSLRFFAGGQNSVRGYDFESLGTQDSNGVVMGGKHLLTASAEYEHPIKDKLSMAAFVDVGNAFEDWSNYDMKWGVGTGVRYQSPIGPIRADVAVPSDNYKDVHFYFSLGPDL